jgi:MFS family permease
MPDADLLQKSNKISNRWFVVVLCTLTFMLVMAVPTLCMPVLFPEIIQDLQLNLVEIGAVWGLIPLSGVVIGVIGGMLLDRFKIKHFMLCLSLLTAISGGLRGLSNDLITLSITSFLFGITSTILVMGGQKAISMWFSGGKLAMAQGIGGTGAAVGFAAGSMLSATILSPLVGGWRNLFFVYGILSVVVSLCWLFLKGEPQREKTDILAQPFIRIFSRVIRIKGVWLTGLIWFGFFASLQGLAGYLPIYLRNLGWPAINADGAMTVYNIAGAFGAIPLAMLSDRLGTRRGILAPLLIFAVLCVGLISFVDGALIWVLAFFIGFIRDGLAAVIIAMNYESKGIDNETAGTSLGLMNSVSRIGPFIAPPIGNSFAVISPGLPFVIWAGFGAISLLGLVSDTRK